jgi:hypothetical protein
VAGVSAVEEAVATLMSQLPVARASTSGFLGLGQEFREG